MAEQLTDFLRQRRSDDVAAKSEAAARQKEYIAKMKERAKSDPLGVKERSKDAIKAVTGKDVDEVLENVKAPTKDARAESIKNSMTRGGGSGIRGGAGTLGGGAGATGADLLRQMNPQKLMKKGGAVKSASARADGIAIRGKTRA
jgi:hypothetical protein